MSYLKELRKEYQKYELSRKDLDKNPFKQFNNWFNFAIKNNISMPNAMSLATTNNNEVSLRTVLLKEVRDSGFIFFTDYSSKKSRQIAINNQVALLFTWLKLDRQIKISGIVKKISKAESLKYFLTRPIDSQLAAYSSKQSSVLSARSMLINEFEKAKNKFKDGKIPLPNWGGYIVIPHKIEFWQGRVNRMHDRFLYYKKDNNWEITRLSP